MFLLETIKIKNKKPYNLDLHNKRMNQVRKTLFDAKDEIDLNEVLKIPLYLDNDLYKCRVVYNNKIHKIEFLKYEFRNIKKLKIVFSDTIEYNFKFENRDEINNLLSLRGECDDILIVKSGRITDTSFSNVILYDGFRWITPATPLLKGIKRELLLKNREIFEDEVYLKDLHFFKKIRLINSMIDFEDAIEVDITNCIY